MNPFSKTIGHKTARNVFLRMIENNRLPHAILLVGPHHVGKTHFTIDLIQHLFKTQRHPSLIVDVSLLKREKTLISVKKTRELIERLAMTPMEGNWKIAFIKEADRLSIGAANALLKTLEEPKGRTLIILRASSVESVLPTIASRCQIFRFAPIATKEISDALQKRGLSPIEANEISKKSFGCPGIAIRYIKDGLLRARKETAVAQVETLLSVSIPEKLQMAIDLIPKTQINKSGVLTRILHDWSEVLRAKLIESVEDNQPENSQKFSQILNKIQEVQSAIPHNINPHLSLEHILLS